MSVFRTYHRIDRSCSQALAEPAGTGQSTISRAEQADYDGWTFKTLVLLAVGLGARLRVNVEPIEAVISLYEEGERVHLVADTAGAGQCLAKAENSNWAFHANRSAEAPTKGTSGTD